MKLTRLSIPDVILIEPAVHGDSRGYFMESWRQDKLDNFLGFSIRFVQDNESSSSTGVLRGLHYQLHPAAQTKLVRVIRGKVLDVAVDIRKGSPTFGQHVAMELSGENKQQLLVPRGFAHGFLVLEDDTIFSYKVDNYYSPENDQGIAWNDPAIGIHWPLDPAKIKLSAKDTTQPSLGGAETFQFSQKFYE